jgi:hypothetical protein
MLGAMLLALQKHASELNANAWLEHQEIPDNEMVFACFCKAKSMAPNPGNLSN